MARITFFEPSLKWHAHDTRVLVSTGPAYVLQLFEGNRLIASVRRDLPIRVPTVDDLAEHYPDGMRLGASCTIPRAILMQDPALAPSMPFVFGLVLLNDSSMWVLRSPPAAKTSVLDVFDANGAYAGTVRNLRLPVGRLPNGELLVPVDDPASGGQLIVRVSARR